MNVLALALAGHLLGDWVVQTDRQAAGKVWTPSFTRGLVWDGSPLLVEAKDPDPVAEYLAAGMVGAARRAIRGAWWQSWWWNQAHVATYHATLALLVGPAWHDGWALAALAASWASHSLIDRRWPVRWLMRRTGSGPFADTSWGVIAVDQALHLSILALLVAARG